MQKRIELPLNNNEKKILSLVAKEHGFKDYHTFLHRKIHELPNLIKKDFVCEKGNKRKSKKIPISNDVCEFYEKLSCSHSTTTTSIIFKYVIYPLIKEYMQQEV